MKKFILHTIGIIILLAFLYPFYYYYWIIDRKYTTLEVIGLINLFVIYIILRYVIGEFIDKYFIEDAIKKNDIVRIKYIYLPHSYKDPNVYWFVQSITDDNVILISPAGEIRRIKIDEVKKIKNG